MMKFQIFKMLMGVFYFSCLFLPGCTGHQVKRISKVIGIKKVNLEAFKNIDSKTRLSILETINKANIHNYSIYLGAINKDTDDYYLFHYFEYTGSNFKTDQADMLKCPVIQEWWKHTEPLQKTPTEGVNEWSEWKEVFHFEGPPSSRKAQRYGFIIGLKSDPESIIAYSQLHAAVWPGVLEAIEKANIRKYSIYLGQLPPDRYLLFSYFEYVGTDFESDMKSIAQDKVTQVWWTYTDPLQIPLPIRKPGEHWAIIDEVYHAD